MRSRRRGVRAYDERNSALSVSSYENIRRFIARILIFVLALGGYLVYQGWSGLKSTDSRSHWLETEGEIIEFEWKIAERGKSGLPRVNELGDIAEIGYVLEYEYVVSDKLYRAKNLGPEDEAGGVAPLRSEFKTLDPGGKVQVLYDPDDPSRSLLFIGDRAQHLADLHYGLRILIPVVCVYLAIAGTMLWERQQRLAKQSAQRG